MRSDEIRPTIFFFAKLLRTTAALIVSLAAALYSLASSGRSQGRAPPRPCCARYANQLASKIEMRHASATAICLSRHECEQVSPLAEWPTPSRARARSKTWRGRKQDPDMDYLWEKVMESKFPLLILFQTAHRGSVLDS